MPSQITNSGARITRGMALSSVITGSSSSATSGIERGGDAEHDADDDAERQPAQRRGEGRLEVRPDAAVGEQVDERGADPARARREQRIEQAGAARRLPEREQQPNAISWRTQA